MYYDDHNPPHFHAAYEGLEATFDFRGKLLRGDLSKRARKLIKEWCELHEEELRKNWEKARADKPLHWIEPLR